MIDLNRVTAIFEIFLAMREVHLAKLIHRDLKPENILIDKNNHVKICYFVVSCISESDSKTKTTGVGTLKFIAPEILNEVSHYNEKVDVYSFGVVMYFILTNCQYPKISIGEVANGKKSCYSKQHK